MLRAVISFCKDRNLRHWALVGVNFMLEVFVCVRATGMGTPAGLYVCVHSRVFGGGKGGYT
jgi:hypothetical protein